MKKILCNLSWLRQSCFNLYLRRFFNIFINILEVINKQKENHFYLRASGPNLRTSTRLLSRLTFLENSKRPY